MPSAATLAARKAGADPLTPLGVASADVGRSPAPGVTAPGRLPADPMPSAEAARRPVRPDLQGYGPQTHASAPTAPSDPPPARSLAPGADSSQNRPAWPLRTVTADPAPQRRLAWDGSGWAGYRPAPGEQAV